MPSAMLGLRKRVLVWAGLARRSQVLCPIEVALLPFRPLS